MTTILHVEDDEFLAGTVHGAFEAFGFPGTFLIASTLKEAERIIGDQKQPLDLVLSDMQLLDGTGLDVVRMVRANRAHQHVPILILAGRADASMVNRAYALGANAYITKTVHGRTPAQVVRTIYDHWLQDTRLPAAAGPGRTCGVIARAMSIRSRISRQYMKIAEQLGTSEGDFWMGVAQREGNLANLLMFLLGQIKNRELPSDVVNDLEAHQKDALRVLDELEGTSSITEDDAFRFLLALSAPTDIPAFVRGVGLLFPAAPVAMSALLDAQASSFETTSAEIETHTKDPALRQGADQLREKATLLRSPVAS